MYEPSYREALSSAFKLIWNNKSLWVFGILAALFVSPFGLNGLWGQLILVGKENFTLLDYSFWIKIFETIATVNNPIDIINIVWLIEIILAVFIVIVFISVCAQTSLIINTCEYYKNKKHSDLDKTWHKSYKYFWKILGYDLIRKISFLLLFLFMFGLWLIIPETSFWFSLFLILSLIIVIFLGLMINALTTYASGYAVFENKKFWAGLKESVLLFKDHFLVSFEISLIMLFLDLILASFIFTVIILSLVPTTIFWFIAGLFNSITILNFSIILSILVITFLIILIGGFYNAFNTSTWMYLFMKMHHRGIFPRLGHLFIKLFQK